jgi:hypothetical protein
MKLFGMKSREERFWQWFNENSTRLFRFESDQEKVFKELGHALSRVEAGLTFEFGPVQDGRREFIVSADGIRDRFPAVRRLVEAAPAMKEWTVIPFRPPKSLEMTIEFGAHKLGPEDVWFTAEQDEDRTGLTLFIRGLTENNQKELGGAGFIMLDNALGEYAVETQIGFIEWKPLPSDPEGAGLRPFRTIREVFDTTTH